MSALCALKRRASRRSNPADALVATAECGRGSVLIYGKPTAGEVAEWLKAAVC